MEEKENLVKKASKRPRFNFEEFLFYLLDYKEERKNINVPFAYVCEDGYKLGQKICHIRYGRIKLTGQQKAKLNEIGFIWHLRTFKFKFDIFYQYLLDYKEERKNIKVPLAYVCKDGYKLGQKIHHIRYGRIKLTEQQKAKLNKIGFIWDTNKFKFDIFYKHLVKFKQEFENINIDERYVCQDGYKLGEKATKVRYGRIKLTEQQKAKLNEIGFVWDAKRFKFDIFYNYLQEYKKDHRDLNVKQSHNCQNGYKLGQKINSIRYGRIKLTWQQKAKLNEIGFVWDATITVKLKKFDFELFFNKLVTYKQQFGDCFVEFDYVIDNFELGFYVKNIRNHRIKLKENQIGQLNNLGFVFNTQEYYKNKPDVPLIKRMINGDISARNDFIQKYMPVVYKIAARYKEIINYSDLVGIGYDGLNLALDNTNLVNEQQLKSYVIKHIKGQIINYLKKVKNVKSLQDDVHGCEGLTIEETIPDNNYRPDAEVEDRAFNEQLLSKAKQILTKDEYKLICLRFGFNKNTTEYTTNQLAERYNTTPQKVEKALQKILIKLKQNLNKDEWLI